MPQLTWMGKDKVKNHHHHVPFHLLDKLYDFQAAEGKPANRRDNLLIHGDNLLALKSLLPEFGGRVDCIYIDPPYNTGNEGWVYNDNVNDPRIQKWLGEVVGREGEDLSRHDKWLCMMYPRLKLLKQLLADDGVIFISIDDNEQAALKLVCDEIFGSANFIGNIVRATGTTAQDTHGLGKAYDNILVFSKSSNYLIGGIPLSESDEKRYNLEDEKGKFSILQLRRTGGEDRREDRPSMYFPILAPDGTEVFPIGPTGYESRWRVGIETVKEMEAENKLYFKKDNDGEWKVYYKYYFENRTKRPSDLWTDLDGNKKASIELKEIFASKVFETPKPVALLEKILTIAASPNAIILDSFIGSGTTAHAVLNLNRKDGGNRRFIGIEMMDYAEETTAERIRRVINGYGSKVETQLGTGGGFAFYCVGDALFDAEHNLNPAAPVASVRRYIAYTEGLPVSALPECERQPENSKGQPENPVSPYFLGAKDGTAYVFHYKPDRATDLSLAFLQTIRAETLPEKPERWVIYADRTLLSEEQMQQLGIIFKRIPRDISKL